MPELPEVETIRRELALTAVGKVFEFVEIKNTSSVKSDPDALDLLVGHKIMAVKRRGKFIIIEISSGWKLVVHLRMTGRLLWDVEPHKQRYVRVVFLFNDGSKLFFSDVRKFGCVWCYDEQNYEKGTGIWKLGLEPLTMRKEDFLSLINRAKGSVKGFLLRQEVMAGIGNIYADEICFRSGVHPEQKVQDLSSQQVAKMYESISVCLQSGIDNCGVSMSDFTGTRGNLGRHQRYLKVYGRGGDSCYNCSSLIKKTRVMGRGTFYCSQCQIVKS